MKQEIHVRPCMILLLKVIQGWQVETTVTRIKAIAQILAYAYRFDPRNPPRVYDRDSRFSFHITVIKYT